MKRTLTITLEDNEWIILYEVAATNYNTPLSISKEIQKTFYQHIKNNAVADLFSDSKHVRKAAEYYTKGLVTKQYLDQLNKQVDQVHGRLVKLNSRKQKLDEYFEKASGEEYYCEYIKDKIYDFYDFLLKILKIDEEENLNSFEKILYYLISFILKITLIGCLIIAPVDLIKMPIYKKVNSQKIRKIKSLIKKVNDERIVLGKQISKLHSEIYLIEILL